MSASIFDPNDEGFRLLVAQFAAELAERADSLDAALQQREWETLRRLAHQLKGAAGCYGFGELTPLAAGVQHLCDQGSVEEDIALAVSELSAMCREIATAEARSQETLSH